MGRIWAGSGRVEQDEVVVAATSGDQAAFTALAERYRWELQVHCYRMLGSFQDAEDLVQETLLRAWRSREQFEGRSSFRAWLYRIATNACLDALASNARRVLPHQVGAPRRSTGDLAALARPRDRLAAALPGPTVGQGRAPRHRAGCPAGGEGDDRTGLPGRDPAAAPRQRAVLILRDVLGWSAKETASLLEASVASANSALQRARATMKQHLPARRLEWAPSSAPTAEERAVLQRYMDATEQADPATLAGLLAEDARCSMPPTPAWLQGREAVMTAMVQGLVPEFGRWRLLPTWANRQPGAACYLRRPGDSEYRAFSIDVLRVEDGKVAEITAFPADLFPAFGLPATL